LKGAQKLLRLGRTKFLVELHSWGDLEAQVGAEDVNEFMASFKYASSPFHGQRLFSKQKLDKIVLPAMTETDQQLNSQPTDQRPIQVAVIGCGAIAERGHLPALSKLDNCSIAMLVDKDLDRASRLAAKHKVPTLSDNYRDALKYADAAILALPHHLHAEIGCELLKAGLHLLIEKPMAMTASECDAMLAAAEEGKAVLAVGLMRRFLHSTHTARWIVQQGLLGQLQGFDFQEGNVFNWPIQSDFLLRRETAGGGVLFDTGAHTLDLLLYWLGDVANFEYYDDSYGGVEADCELRLTMASGVQGTVQLSRTRDLRNTAIIEGDRAILEVNLRRNWLTVRSHDGESGLVGYGLAPDSFEMVEQQFADLFKPQLEDWLAAIRGEHPPTVPGTEARRSVALIEACYAQRRQLEFPWNLQMVTA
jgi:predicted dehydrogenase